MLSVFFRGAQIPSPSAHSHPASFQSRRIGDDECDREVGWSKKNSRVAGSRRAFSFFGLSIDRTALARSRFLCLQKYLFPLVSLFLSFSLNPHQFSPFFFSNQPNQPNEHSYDQYAQAWDCGVDIPVGNDSVRFFHTKGKDGVDRVFVDHESFLAKVWGKTGAKLYGSAAGSDYADNQARFALFCR